MTFARVPFVRETRSINDPVCTKRIFGRITVRPLHALNPPRALRSRPCPMAISGPGRCAARRPLFRPAGTFARPPLIPRFSDSLRPLIVARRQTITPGKRRTENVLLLLLLYVRERIPDDDAPVDGTGKTVSDPVTTGPRSRRRKSSTKNAAIVLLTFSVELVLFDDTAQKISALLWAELFMGLPFFADFPYRALQCH